MMLSNKQYHGAQPNMDLDPSLLRRDIRPMRYKIKDFIANYSGHVLGIMAILSFLIPFQDSLPQITDWIFVFGIMYYFFAKKRLRQYNFGKPMTMVNGKVENDGILLLGNEKVDGTGVWFSNDDLRTHFLIFGSTGSGKTRTLLSILYQTLLMGSGCMYCDGKADNTVAWLVYSIARRLGREDDMLVINYLTGGDVDVSGKISLSRLSNTTNPFAYGNPEQLRSLIVGLMRDSGGDNMWKGRASAMIGGLMRALTYMRDSGEINLDVEKLREYLPLDRIVELTSRVDLPDTALAPIRKYLGELPGYTEEEAVMGTIQPKAYEQHGYLTMQLTEVMANLSDTYGHIFAVPLGEVDFKDVVFNRRILFVMLPALEVDPDALSGLGKLVVAAVRAALGPALGNKVEGTRADVIETKPTNSDVPFMLILDEYGYYAVKGFAVVAAQARSLGVGVIFAGQDYPSFSKGDEIEAKATIANTNIKFCMKLEDAKDTYEVMAARAGKADQVVTQGHEVKGAMGAYHDQATTRVEKVDRLAIEDLVDQDPGEGWVIFRNTIKPIATFFAAPVEVEEAELNKFVMVSTPDKQYIRSLHGAVEKYEERFGIKKASEELTKVTTDKSIISFINDYKALTSRNESSQESSIAAVGMLEYKDKIIDKDIAVKAGLDAKLDEALNFASVNSLQESLTPKTQSVNEINSDMDSLSSISVITEEDSYEETNLQIMDVSTENSVQDEAMSISDAISEVLTSTVVNMHDKHAEQPMTMQQRVEVEPREQLKNISQVLNLPGLATDESSDKLLKDIVEKANQYPHKPTPEKLEKDNVEDSLRSLLNKVDKKK